MTACVPKRRSGRAPGSCFSQTIPFCSGAAACSAGRCKIRPAAGSIPSITGAYGEGEPPVFCGSQSLSDPAQWENVGGSIWRFTGMLSGETANLIYGDGTCGALRWTREELCEQGDWFDSCLGYSIQHLPLAEDHTLLVYSQENPAAFYGSIECATSQYRWLAHCGHDMVISDLEFRNNGLHGIAGEEGGRESAHRKLPVCQNRRRRLG